MSTQSGTGHRWLVLMLATCAGCVALSSPAEAWVVTRDTGHLTVVGDQGVVNALTVSDAPGGGVELADDLGSPFTSTLPASCSTVSPSRIDCDPGTVTGVTVTGGALTDTLTNDSALSGVLLDGAEGADTLYAGGQGDVLRGGDGDDVLYGASGNDSLDGAAGADQLYAGAGADSVDGGSGDDQLIGGAGDDALTAGDGTDTANGGDGTDLIDGGDGPDVIVGDDGNDTLNGGRGSDTIDGGTGNDVLHGAAGNDTVSGSDGADTLTGDDGDDTLAAAGGNDSLSGGDGRDALDGGEGNDGLAGDSGDDELDGGLGNDALDGGDGSDRLVGGDGADVLAGGLGTDTADYSADDAAVSITTDGYSNDGAAGDNDDVRSDVESLVGGQGDDTITALDGAHTLLGGPGDDRLTAGAAADVLAGGDGDDVLDGGAGSDAIAGGPDTDTVTYASRTAPVTVSLADPGAGSGEAGEHDQIDGAVENAIGGSGNDTLNDAAGIANNLVGGPGNDTFQIEHDTTASDTAHCGAGADIVHADRVDGYDADCEQVTVAGRQVRPSVGPRIFLGTTHLRVTSRGTVAILVQCALATNGVCSGTARLAMRIGRAAIAAHARLRVVSGARVGVRLHLTPRDLRRVRRHQGLLPGTLRLAVKDPLGRSVKRTIKVRVRAPKRAA